MYARVHGSWHRAWGTLKLRRLYIYVDGPGFPRAAKRNRPRPGSPVRWLRHTYRRQRPPHDAPPKGERDAVRQKWGKRCPNTKTRFAPPPDALRPPLQALREGICLSQLMALRVGTRRQFLVGRVGQVAQMMSPLVGQSRMRPTHDISWDSYEPARRAREPSAAQMQQTGTSFRTLAQSHPGSIPSRPSASHSHQTPMAALCDAQRRWAAPAAGPRPTQHQPPTHPPSASSPLHASMLCLMLLQARGVHILLPSWAPVCAQTACPGWRLCTRGWIADADGSRLQVAPQHSPSLWRYNTTLQNNWQ
jgi:hypothetical protein